VAQDHPSLEGAETAAAARTPSQKKGSPATEAGRRRSGWCGGVPLGASEQKGAEKNLSLPCGGESLEEAAMSA
jgi:hypothetical protein